MRVNLNKIPHNTFKAVSSSPLPPKAQAIAASPPPLPPKAQAAAEKAEAEKAATKAKYKLYETLLNLHAGRTPITDEISRSVTTGRKTLFEAEFVTKRGLLSFIKTNW